MQPNDYDPPLTLTRLGCLRARLGRWVSDWQEALSQLPTLVVLVVAAAFLVPAISRQAGVPVVVEYLPEVGSAFVVTFKLALSGFSAWLLKRLYMQNLSKADEARLQERLEGTPNMASLDKGALLRIGGDRVEFFALFLVCVWAHFS